MVYFNVNLMKKGIFSFLVGVVYWLPLWAESGISVSTYDGGVDLNFGRVSSSTTVAKEVKIRITSNLGKQYQVFQRLEGRLVNERGVILNPSAVVFSTLRGSNSTGSLYQEEPVGLSYNDQLLYVSNPQGDSDSFFVVYTFRGERLNAYGQFLGKIVYTLRPLGEGEEKIAILNVCLKAEGGVKIEIQTNQRRDTLCFSTQGSQQQGYVQIFIKGNLENKDLKVYQQMIEGLKNEVGEELDCESLEFLPSGGVNDELAVKEKTKLIPQRALVYSSSAQEDNFFINFSLNKQKLSQEKAGLYRGKVEYTIEGEDVRQSVYLDLEVEVQPIFNLEVIFPPEGMNFAELFPHSPPQFKEVKIKVNTNLARPYVVVHSMSSPLINEKGEEVKGECFTVKEEKNQTCRGKIKFVNFTPLPVGDVPIFFSDEEGSPAEFSVIYQLKFYPRLHSGHYSTVVNYSLLER